MSDHISLKCSSCGSKDFVLPHQPPHDDDIITCAGCKKEMGRYDDVRKAATTLAKAEVDKIVQRTFGKKPTWTKR